MSPSIVAVSAYYNPFKGELRRKNFHYYRQHLGIPLVVVEWSPTAEFDLQQGDADVLIQIDGGDVLWQKERLLNIGLTCARNMARHLAFLDADIIFTDPNWVGRVSAALSSHPLIQCYSQVDYLPPLPLEHYDKEAILCATPEVSLPSRALSFDQGQLQCLCRPGTSPFGPANAGNPGMAVALNTEKLPNFSFYEGNLVGGGDAVLVAAACGLIDKYFQVHSCAPQHQAHIRRWAAQHFPTTTPLGYADNRLLHLWHGSLKNRRYVQRQHILTTCDYDPERDITPNTDGALRLIPSANKMRAAILKYLNSRQDA